MGVVRKLIHELHRRSIWQVLITFAGGSWVVLEVIDQLTETAGLPDWVPTFALVLLLIGLPIVVATAFVQEGVPSGREKQPEAEGEPSAAREGGPRPGAQSAAAVSRDDAVAEGSRNPGFHSRLFTWRKAILGGVGAFSLLGVAVAGYFAMRLLGVGPVASLMAQGVLEERDPVVLADFQNRSSDISAGDLVTETLRVDLVNSRVLTLASPSRVQDVLARMGRESNAELTSELALEVAERAGFKAVIQGEVASAGEGYVLIASLVATESQDILASFREAAASPDDLVDAIDKLSERIREKVGESLRTIRAGEPLGEVTTASIEALRKYTDAMRLVEMGEGVQAIGLLEEATQIDTAFAMAYRKLAAEMANRGFPGARIREAATKAYQHRDRLGEIERYLTAAAYHENVTEDPDAVIQAYRNVLRLEPHDKTALNNLAVQYFSVQQFEEGKPLLDTAMAVAPFAILYCNAVANYLMRGDTDGAAQITTRFEQEYPGHWRALFSRLRVEIYRENSQGVHDAAAALSAAATAPWDARAAGVAGGIFADQPAGKWRESQEHIREAIRFAEENDAPTTALDWALAEAESLLLLVADTTAARRRMREVLTGEAFEALPPTRRPWARVTRNLINSGMIEEAQEYFDRWEAEVAEADRPPGYSVDRDGVRGYLDLALSGDVDAAIRAVRQWMVEAHCERCERFEMAELEARRGRTAEAIDLLELVVEEPNSLATYPLDRMFALERLGPLYEQAEEHDKAIDAYTRFAEAWKDADPELRPRVQAALAAAERLRARAPGG